MTSTVSMSCSNCCYNVDLNEPEIIEIPKDKDVKSVSNKNEAIYGLNQRTMLAFQENGLSGRAVDIFCLFLNIGNKTLSTAGKSKWEHHLF